MLRLGAGLPLRSSSVLFVRTLTVSGSGSGKLVRRVSKTGEPDTLGVEGDWGRGADGAPGGRPEVVGKLKIFAIWPDQVVVEERQTGIGFRAFDIRISSRSAAGSPE